MTIDSLDNSTPVDGQSAINVNSVAENTLPYRIIHQHEDFWLLEKLAGAPMHTRQDSPGLLRKLGSDYPWQRFWPVHRLDTVTSGLLLVARSKEAAASFGDLFARHQVDKYYLAISDRKPTRKQGTIKGDMERSRRGGWKLCQSRNNPAITQFKSTAMGEGKRLFLLHPLSGKTHQLRVALKSLSAPIIGDARYHAVTQAQTADRCYLHAYALSFQWQGESHHFVLPPADGALFIDPALTALLPPWAKPWELSWPKV